MNSAPLLELEHVDVYYGQSHALQNVSLFVPAGSVVTLLGRNGAGKSTLLKTIMGIERAQAGRVEFAGQDITRLEPHMMARLGIGYVPEERAVFPSLNVEENLLMGARAGTRRTADGHSTRWNLERVYKAFPRLAERRRHGGNALSGGEQQMVAIARALMVNPKLLLMDEPTEGLAPIIVNEIATTLNALKDHGLTMLLVEQNYPFARMLGDRTYVLGKGRMRWMGATGALESDEDTKSTWIGV